MAMASTKQNQSKKNQTSFVITHFTSALVVVVTILTCLSPLLTQSATLGLQSLSAQVSPAKNFTVRVVVNTQGKTINNAEGVIRFPKDLVDAVSVSSGGSIFSLWVEPPSFSNGSGTISFNGGVPNPGFKGSGQVMSVVFKAKKAGTANLTFTSAAVRENDGLGTNILTGQGGASIAIVEEKPTEPEEPVTPPTTGIERVVIASTTHPDSNSWYKETKASFRWNIPSGATASQTLFDQNPNSLPVVLYRPPINSVTIDKVEADGVWYVHARFQVKQVWSPVYSYKIQVDTTPPTDLRAVVEPNAEGRLTAKLSATDQLSQVAYYTVALDDQLPLNVPSTAPETIALLPPVSKGTHNLTVTVFDKAGNSTPLTQNFENEGETGIRITDYTKQIKDNDSIRVEGIAPADTPIRISLSTQEGLIRYYYVKSNSTGDFVFTSEPVVGGEVYTLWAEIEGKEGQPALSSQQVTIKVEDSWASWLRHQLDYLKTLITWTNIIILTLFLSSVMGWYEYWRLRRKYIRKVSQRSTVKNLSDMLNKKIKK